MNQNNLNKWSQKIFGVDYDRLDRFGKWNIREKVKMERNKKYERDAKLAFASMVGIGVLILIAILVEIITK